LGRQKTLPERLTAALSVSPWRPNPETRGKAGADFLGVLRCPFSDGTPTTTIVKTFEEVFAAFISGLKQQA